MSKIKAKSEVVIDFGTRTINRQNFSRTVVLPKDALRNCGCDYGGRVRVQLVQRGNEKYLKLSPQCDPKEVQG